MIEYTPFRADHLRFLVPQPAQRREMQMLIASGGAEALEPYIALTAWAGVRCIGCAGLITITPHRAVAWALLGEAAGRHLLGVARKVRRVIEASPYRRVEFTVADGFAQGHRFAGAIGAKLETPLPMRAYGTMGNDEYMYAVVKNG